MTADNELAAAFVAAIHSGDIDAVQRIVAETPELVRGPLGGRFKTRTALHVVADWPDRGRSQNFRAIRPSPIARAMRCALRERLRGGRGTVPRR